MRKLTLAAATIAAALIALPSAASAATFTATSGDPGSITTAINAANAADGSDLVVIPAGTYAITSSTFPAFGTSPYSITIVGAGVGQTIFNGAADGAGLINVELPTSTSEISGYTLNAVAPTNFTFGVSLYRGNTHDFEINMSGAPGTGISALSVNSPGAEITDGKITTTSSHTGISAFNGPLSLRRVTLTGGTGGAGISAGGTVSAFASRVKVTGYSTGIILQNGTFELEDSLINMGAATGAIGIYAKDQDNGSASALNLEASRTTVVGTGANQVGIYTGTSQAGDTASGRYRDSVSYNADPTYNAFLCTGNTGNSVEISGLANRGFFTGSTGCPSSPATGTVTLTSSPFVDLAGGDFRPAANSPLIDAGQSTDSAGSEDVNGSARVVDGNSDGTALVDIGGFEYQLPPPVVPGGGGGGTPPATPSPAKPAATISAKPKRSFKIGKKGFALVTKGSPTFAVKFTDAATARFTIAKQKSAQTIKVKSGTNKFTFGGTWNKKKLKAGSYKVTITPQSATGLAGTPVTVTVKLKK